VAVAPAGTPNAGDVYVTATVNNGNSPSVLLAFDSSGHSIQSPITVGYLSEGVAVAPAGTPNAGDVYVTSLTGAGNGTGGTLTVVSPTNTVIGTPINFGSGNQPSGVAVSPLTGEVYLVNQPAELIYEIPPTNSGFTSFPTGAGTGPVGVAVSPLTGNVFVTDFVNGGVGGGVHEFSSTGTVITNFNVGNIEPGAVAVSPTTGDVYVANTSFQPFISVINPSLPSNGAVSTIPLADSSGGVAVAPNGTAVYATYTQNLTGGVNSVGVINPATDAVTPIPVEPLGSEFFLGQLAVGPNGDVYVIQNGGPTLYVISDP
jgi:DNA-binding beta-propeller fold protein YncE